jgi:hypothetical protein
MYILFGLATMTAVFAVRSILRYGETDIDWRLLFGPVEILWSFAAAMCGGAIAKRQRRHGRLFVVFATIVNIIYFWDLGEHAAFLKNLDESARSIPFDVRMRHTRWTVALDYAMSQPGKCALSIGATCLGAFVGLLGAAQVKNTVIGKSRLALNGWKKRLSVSKVVIHNPTNGIEKVGDYGYSWTYLFFGWFVPLFRGEAGVAAAHLLFTVVTLGVWQIVGSFIYNKQHLTRLLEKGYVLRDAEQKMVAARAALGAAQPGTTKSA